MILHLHYYLLKIVKLRYNSAMTRVPDFGGLVSKLTHVSVGCLFLLLLCQLFSGCLLRFYSLYMYVNYQKMEPNCTEV